VNRIQTVVISPFQMLNLGALLFMNLYKLVEWFTNLYTVVLARDSEQRDENSTLNFPRMP
jgi:hypothetical protein